MILRHVISQYLARFYIKPVESSGPWNCVNYRDLLVNLKLPCIDTDLFSDWPKSTSKSDNESGGGLNNKVFPC